MLLNLMWENSFNKKNRNSLFSFFNIILLEKIKKNLRALYLKNKTNNAIKNLLSIFITFEPLQKFFRIVYKNQRIFFKVNRKVDNADKFP